MGTFQIKDPLQQSFGCKGFQIVSSVWNNLRQLISFFFPMKRMRKWPSTSNRNQILVALLNLIRTDYQSGRSFCCFIHWVKGTYKFFIKWGPSWLFQIWFDQILRIDASPKTPQLLLTHLLFLFLLFWSMTRDPTWQAICIPNSSSLAEGQWVTSSFWK